MSGSYTPPQSSQGTLTDPKGQELRSAQHRDLEAGQTSWRGTEVCAGNPGNLRDPWRVVGVLGGVCTWLLLSAPICRSSSTQRNRSWGVRDPSPEHPCSEALWARTAQCSGVWPGGEPRGVRKGPSPKQGTPGVGNLPRDPLKVQTHSLGPSHHQPGPQTGDPPSPQNSDASTRNPSKSYQKTGIPRVPFKPGTPKPCFDYPSIGTLPQHCEIGDSSDTPNQGPLNPPPVGDPPNELSSVPPQNQRPTPSPSSTLSPHKFADPQNFWPPR